MSIKKKFYYPEYLSGKNILVMGLGLHGGGIGTVKFLARGQNRITVTDLRPAKELAASLRQLKGIKNLRWRLGRHEAEDFEKTDLIIKGPGVRPDSEFLKIARKKNIPVLTDIGIFLQECPGRIIGVTGTRGKSTAAFLIWKLLQTKLKRVHLAGNIRRSVLELLSEVKKEDWVVLELSSFQLQDLEDSGVKVSGKPEIAVLTNLLPDHLNWHRNFSMR